MVSSLLFSSKSEREANKVVHDAAHMALPTFQMSTIRRKLQIHNGTCLSSSVDWTNFEMPLLMPTKQSRAMQTTYDSFTCGGSVADNKSMLKSVVSFQSKNPSAPYYRDLIAATFDINRLSQLNMVSTN